MVIMALAASVIPVLCKLPTNSSSLSVIRSCGSGSPITPVEEENILSSSIPSARAAAAVTARVASIPFCPVNALELPEFTTIPAAPVPSPPILA